MGRPSGSEPPRTVEGLDRNATVRAHLPKVRYLARRLASRLPSDASLSVDDLISHGSIGLLEAFDHFDQRYGIKFSSYAEHRIRGAMLDALRRTDPLGRRQRALARQAEQARTELAHRHGRAPTASDVAERLGVALEQYFRVQEDLAVASKPSSSHHSTGLEVLEGLARESTSRTLARALDTLPARQRSIVELVYLKGMQGKDIAALMGLSKARISQLLSDARKRLKLAIEQQAREQGLSWWEAIGDPTR